MNLDHLLNIDNLVVYAYLLITLVMGLYVGRNVKSMKDYAIANKIYSSPILIVTLLATIMGGTSTIGIAENVYRDGIIMIVATSGYIFGYLFIATYIAPKMGRFNSQISVGDIMHNLHGKFGQVITGLIGFLFCIAIFGAQILAIGCIFETTFSLGRDTGIYLGAATLIIYSSFGGMRAVTITDLVQFAILIIMIPLIANVAVQKVGGLGALIAQIPEANLKIWEHDKFWEYSNTWFVWGLFPAFLMSPPIVQRMLMAHNKEELAKMFYISAIFTIPFEAMVMLIAFVALILYPTIDPALAMPHVINGVLPPIIKGMAVAGILAVIMSTADSFLHSATISLVHDVIKPTFTRWKFNELRLARIASVFVGLCGVAMAIYAKNIIALELYAVGLWGPLITIPLVLGILEVKIPLKVFKIALLTSTVIFIGWNTLSPIKYTYLSSLFAIISNAMVYLLHWILYYNKKKL